MGTPIVNHPCKVFTYLAPEGGIYDDHTRLIRKKHLLSLADRRAKVSCFPLDSFMCLVFPEWMLEAGPSLLSHRPIRNELIGNPLFGVKLLLAGYEDAQPILERAVLGSGEATVPLLRAIDEGKIKPRSPRSLYEESLLKSPWWALQYLNSPAANPDLVAARMSFADQLRSRVALNAKESGQAALVHLLLNPALEPNDFRSALHSDAMSAYLASRLLNVRGFTGSVADIRELDPRWSMHVALWGGFMGGNVNERIEDAITKHPGWAGEYIISNENRRLDWSWASGVYTRTEKQYHASPGTQPSPWHDVLWGTLDRICVQIEGGDPRMTLDQSFERSKNLPQSPQN